jgi:hypothetical protein
LIFLIASLVSAVVIGVTLVHIFFPLRKRGAFLLKISLGTGLGLGITSCVLFLSLFIFGPRFSLVPEIVLVIMALGAWMFMIKKRVPAEVNLSPAGREKFKYGHILAAVFGFSLLSSLVSFAVSVAQEPHGKWDAWLIWNMHARFIYRAGEHWQNYFHSGLSWTHPDYPLMLPLSIVRSWNYMGAEPISVPIAIAFLFTCALIGLVVSSLVMLRSESQGYLGGLVLLGSPFFILMGASQLADIPLAFFLLATVVLFFVHDRSSGRRHPILILAGVAAGLMAWTKNEGFMILSVLILVRFFVVAAGEDGWKGAVKQVLWLMAGLVPVLLAVAVFKMHLAPPPDLFVDQDIQKIWARLTDLQRYKTILYAYIHTGLTFTQGIPDIRTGFRLNLGIAGIVLLAVYLFLSGISVERKDKGNILCVLIFTLITLGSYFAVYLITPHDLDWHLMTSLNRLLLQLWPTIIFITFIAARTPEMVFPSEERRRRETGAASDKAGKRKRKGE